MIFPVGDTPNPPGTPLVTYALIGVNVAIYLLVTLPFSRMTPDLLDPLLLEYLRSLGAYGTVSAADIQEYVSAYDLVVYRFGFRPAEFSLVSLFTSLFLHGGFLHLAGNMLFLWIFGDNVEQRLGRSLFLAGYLLFGVMATLFFALFSLDSQIPLIGASGAISGVLGCYYLWFPRNRVRCFLLLFPFLMTTIMVPARIVLAFYLLVDNLLPFLLNRGGGIAHGAHIGGFIAGLGLAAVIQYGPGFRPGRHNPRSAAKADHCSPRMIGDAVARGEIAAAASCFLHLQGREQRQAVASSDILEMGERLLEKQEYRKALSIFRHFIAEHQNDPQLDRAYLGAGYALAAQPRHDTGAYHYFLSAVDLARTEALADEARRQLRMIEQRGRSKDSGADR
ncbi:MAG TPA: rhomboid family intramembrane serine protease [Geopsychrobacteraceae bacterium]